MRHLLQQDYIPFGSQYYRAPSPHRTEWETDLKKMAALGFNTVKFWVQWRWNHPGEDKFYFDDIDRLMDLAQTNHLRVMLNTIFDVAPAWIYRKYPDASMITLDGRRIGPQTQPHRQIGGLGYCFNHDGIMHYFYRFLEETVKRYKDHPAMCIWNVGSEPELTSSMAEMRLYADDADKMGDMLCYCSHCQTKFKNWLAQKYEAIEHLNESWNRNYASFEDVEVPLTRNTFNDLIDWRMFFVHTLQENVRHRFEIAQTIDQGRHPLMCHHVFIQGFPITSTANDPWNVAQFGDLHGFTQMDDAMMIDVLRSCAKDKPVISAEMLALPGYTLDLPKPIDANDVKRFIFSGVAGNLKGFIFWQYRPEILGREAPTWGLTWLDGSETPWLQAYAGSGRVLQKNAAFLLDVKPDQAKVALLYHPQNQIFGWAASGNEKNVTDSLLGFHRALYEHNYVIDFIHPKEFDADILQNYKVLCVPFPYLLSRKICDALIEWVAQGGVLIGESYFAAWNLEHGHHEKVVPGYGLDKVFQVRQAVVAPANSQGEVDIILDKELPFVAAGERIHGALVKETFFLEGAECLAHFETGEPAITRATFGKGQAILIGSYIGLPYHRAKLSANGRLIASLVEMAYPVQRPWVSIPGKVRVDVLRAELGRAMMIVQNLHDERQEVTIQLPENRTEQMVEQFSSEKIEFIMIAERALVRLVLNPKEVKVYCGL